MDLGGLSNTIGTVLQGLVALCGAFLFAFWLALIIWAWRDIRAARAMRLRRSLPSY